MGSSDAQNQRLRQNLSLQIPFTQPDLPLNKNNPTIYVQMALCFISLLPFKWDPLDYLIFPRDGIYHHAKKKKKACSWSPCLIHTKEQVGRHQCCWDPMVRGGRTAEGFRTGISPLSTRSPPWQLASLSQFQVYEILWPPFHDFPVLCHF